MAPPTPSHGRNIARWLSDVPITFPNISQCGTGTSESATLLVSDHDSYLYRVLSRYRSQRSHFPGPLLDHIYYAYTHPISTYSPFLSRALHTITTASHYYRQASHPNLIHILRHCSRFYFYQVMYDMLASQFAPVTYYSTTRGTYMCIPKLLSLHTY